MIKSFT